MAALAPQASVGVERTFVGLPSPTLPRSGPGGHPCQGLYWTRRGQPRPRVAAIAAHYSADFAEHYIAPYLAAQGIGFLGWNTRFRGADDLFLLEPALIDLGVGVRWLKEDAGAEIVVILGNSGGGSLMAAYQAEATSPLLARESKGLAGDALANLIAGDFFVTLAAHAGRPDVLTSWIDPSVTDETDSLGADPALDAFNPKNGPPYSEEFISLYREAQRARNIRISDWAQAQLAVLEAQGAPDRVFPLFRVWADLRFLDPRIDPSDRPTPRCYMGDPAVANRRVPGLARACTLRTWLSMWSLAHSRCRGEQHLKKINVPALVIQATRDVGVFPSDARGLLEALGSADKSMQIAAGGHFFEDSSTERERVAEVISGWVAART
jgi:pimeloyl-ACP methyl ester carboxylesterase